ncbi:glycosyltransferase family 2 protein [Carboxylicivirga linearis]|uniref:Glycosyltransferase family 2 protein n=1 Tax=Carboxylicivirga linearis TaxID=1628157 RepID=A0ABS5JSJ3_9BACT|nr:glycosyltransferase family 2 protein [Carboxylicivirga linearis]MBS2097881.1 glycosyltransferase family 2 protein [Carboxylicivirga linearis]
MNKLFQKYLSKHEVYNSSEQDLDKKDIRVVIPVFLEQDYIDSLLESIVISATKCDVAIQLVLVVNYAEGSSPEVMESQHRMYNYLLKKKEEYSCYFSIAVIQAYNLKKKHAGAGWARKIGMDYAVFRYNEEQNPKGIILSLDADCKVKSDYFNAVWKKFNEEPINGFTIQFQHEMVGVNEIQKEAILQYELHLRYYLKALRWAGHPYAFHTVGSCFAVTAEAYVRAGGMPRKQAGEDFYFLQKVIPLGRFKELNNTCVYPSSRISNRVPFGTGPTVSKLMKNQNDYLTYNLQAFVDLKEMLDEKEKFFKVDEEQYADLINNLSGRIRSFLLNSNFYQELSNINNNCASLDAFKKRFFEVFDAFKVVKYLNYVHVHFLEKIAVFDAALDLIDLQEKESDDLMDTLDLLTYYRKWEIE